MLKDDGCLITREYGIKQWVCVVVYIVICHKNNVIIALFFWLHNACLV